MFGRRKSQPSHRATSNEEGPGTAGTEPKPPAPQQSGLPVHTSGTLPTQQPPTVPANPSAPTQQTTPVEPQRPAHRYTGAEYVFTHPPESTPFTPAHIRRSEDGTIRLTGGVEGVALCGHPIDTGWDTPSAVTERTVTDWVQPRPKDGRVLLCLGCATAYLERNGAPARTGF